MRRDRSNSFSLPWRLTSRSRPIQKSSSSCGTSDHRRDALLAQCLEDDARRARADEEDVRADHRAEHQHRRLLEQVRRRQQADRAVLARRQDLGDRLERREDRAVLEHHALGHAGRARRVDHLEERLAVGRGQASTCASQSAGNGSSRPPSSTCSTGVSVGWFGTSHSTVLMLRCSQTASDSIGRVETGADRQPLRSGAVGDALEHVRGHAQVERHDDQRRRASRRSRRPAERASTGSRSAADHPASGPARRRRQATSFEWY